MRIFIRILFQPEVNMKERLLLIVIIVLSCLSVKAQSSWQLFSPVSKVNELEFFDNKAYVATEGGLLVIDLFTFEETLYNADNSGIVDNNVRAIEFLSDGTYWLHTAGGLSKFDGQTYTNIVENGPWVNVFDFTVNDDRLWFSKGNNLSSIIDSTILTHTNLPYPSFGISIDNENMWVGSNKISKIIDDKVTEEIEFPMTPEGCLVWYFTQDDQHYVVSYRDVWSHGVLEARIFRFQRYNQGSWNVVKTAESSVDRLWKNNIGSISYTDGFYYGEIVQGVFNVELVEEMFPDLYLERGLLNVVAKESEGVFWATDRNDTGDFSLFRIDLNTTSIEETEDQLSMSIDGFTLYPNPTHTSFYLSFKKEESRKIEIINNRGQLVKTVVSNNSDIEFNITELGLTTKGIYFVKVSTSSGEVIEKLVVY